MLSNSEKTQGRATCAVEVSADQVLAGSSLTVSVQVSSGDVRDLSGLEVRLLDDRGSLLERRELSSADGSAGASARFDAVAPPVVGPRAWTVLFPSQPRGGVMLEETRSPVAFTVGPRPIRAHASGLPAAPVAGSVVGLRVGAKGGLAMAGRGFEVLDARGDVAASGRFGAEPVAGSDGVYDAEVQLAMPSDPGLHTWTLRVPGFDAPLPHATALHAFTLRTVPVPDATVTATVLDRATRSPIEGAQVVLHPFRGTTDARGIATVSVAPGGYRLFASAPGYDIQAVDVEVGDHLEVEADLAVEVEPDPGDHYV